MGLGPPICPVCHIECSFTKELKEGMVIDLHNKNEKRREFSHYVCDTCGVVGGYDHLYSRPSARTATSSPKFVKIPKIISTLC
jgi:hypothetical protein